MLVLNIEKENELVKKYGFEIRKYSCGIIYYQKNIKVYGKYLSISGKDCSYTVEISTMSKVTQDMVYDLIKNDVFLKKETSKNDLLNKRIQSKERRIAKLQEEIKKIQSEME